MTAPTLLERRDRRTLEWLVVAGVVLPLATVGAVRWAALTWGLSTGVVLLLLFGLPLIAGLLLIGSGPWEVGPLGRSPDTGPERFRDQIPDRYHEEFALETLNETVEEDPGPDPRRRFGLLYCFMVPAFALVVMLL